MQALGAGRPRLRRTCVTSSVLRVNLAPSERERDNDGGDMATAVRRSSSPDCLLLARHGSGAIGDYPGPSGAEPRDNPVHGNAHGAGSLVSARHPRPADPAPAAARRASEARRDKGQIGQRGNGDGRKENLGAARR